MVEQKHEATAGHEDDFFRGESHLAGRFRASASTASLVLQEAETRVYGCAARSGNHARLNFNKLGYDLDNSNANCSVRNWEVAGDPNVHRLDHQQCM